MKTVEKVWGEELWIVNNELYCSKILKLKKQHICSYHCHKIKDETFYVMSGVVFMKHNDKEMFMTNDSLSLRILPGEYHSFLGITRSEILEVSTQHFEEDSYRMNESRLLSNEVFNKYVNDYLYGRGWARMDGYSIYRGGEYNGKDI